MNLSELDYYNILDVPRTATKGEILISYRKLATRLLAFQDVRDFVPVSQEDRKTHMTPIPLNRQWEYINMSCDVLGNDLRRYIYDRFGESGLLQGIRLPNGYFPPYRYHGNHMKIYHDIFGSYSPYSNIIDAVVGTSLPLYSNKGIGVGSRTKERPVVKRIGLDLEDAYTGCIKLMHVWRQEFVGGDDLRTEKRKKTLTLNIQPGIVAGTQFIFKEEGDRHPTKIPSDIIFVVEDKPHKRFKRINHHDIVYVHEINLCQALTGFQFTINTLDRRQLKISISDVVHPEFIKLISREGLPKATPKSMRNSECTSTEYGDLVIQFREYLSKEMKRITRIFFTDIGIMEEEEATKDSTCHYTRHEVNE